MTETLCDSGGVKLKAGSGISTSLTPANFTTLINQAESAIAVDLRIDVVSGYSGYDVNKKKILEDACSSKASIQAIAYDMSGYDSTEDAVLKMNINVWTYNQAIKKLGDGDKSAFLIK